MRVVKFLTARFVLFYSRLYITFVDADPANVGYNGTTFHQIFGGK